MRKELGVVLWFAGLSALPFVFKPVHVDEPHFLAIASHALKDPLHPADFAFNGYGRTESMERQQNNPPLLPLLEAAALGLAGERPWLLKLLFLPFDLLGAAAIYLLAARFLRRPLWPALLGLASPAYFINMQHLMAEKVAIPLGLWGLYATVRGLLEERPGWLDAAAALFAAAMLAKYNAVWLLLVAAIFAARRGLSPSRLARFGAISLGPVAAYAAAHALGGVPGGDPLLRTLAESLAHPWAGPLSRLRALGAFVGGCSATTLWLGALLRRARSRRLAAACAAAAALLFLPLFDIEAVRRLDRLLGFAWFASAAFAGWALLEERARGKELWTVWFLAGAAATFTYWSVTARVAVLAVLPLTLGLAAVLEARGEDTRRLYPASFAAMLVLTAALSWVDFRFALAQRRAAESEALARPAGTLWFAGHWGFQYYMERAGGRPLDAASGGWDAVRPGDRVAAPRVNANILRPHAPLLADARRTTVEEPLPLRLLSGWDGQAAFYSSAFGFLPYSLSAEPLDEFDSVDVR